MTRSKHVDRGKRLQLKKQEGSRESTRDSRFNHIINKLGRGSRASYLMIATSVIVAVTTSCGRVYSDGPGALIRDDFLLKDIVVGNARFTPISEDIVLAPAEEYVLNSSDTVEACRDTVEYHWQRVGTTYVFHAKERTGCDEFPTYETHRLSSFTDTALYRLLG